MCGIAGFWDRSGAIPARPEILVAMARALAHRGPDDERVFVEGSLGLAFRRLSIIDPEGGAQPLFGADGSLVLICNGEIANEPVLREELERRGHRFRTGSDVEVALHLYEDEGADFVRRLDGQFSLALFARDERRLLLARDRFGITPLHVYEAGTTIVFASEVKALLAHPLVERAVDLVGLEQIVTFPGLVSPRTLFAGVSSVPPGHLLDVRPDGSRTVQYWDLDYPRRGERDRRSPQEYADGVRERFSEAVRRRMRGADRLGILLSGGLDSSMIACAARAIDPRREIHTFSVSFPAASGIDETRYQRSVANRIGAIHHEIPITAREIAAGFEEMIRHAECAVTESYNVCSLYLARAVHEAGIKVVLCGEGADELFAGYPGYRFDRLREERGRPRAPDAAEADALERLFGSSAIVYELPVAAGRRRARELLSDAAAERLRAVDTLTNVVRHDRLAGRHAVHQRSYLDVKLRLADHLLGDHGDRMLLAHAVEGRYPFLDAELVDFVLEIPPELHVHDYVEKYVLKRAAEGLVPAEIIAREKFGFRAPGSRELLHLADAAERFGGAIGPETVRSQRYLDADAVAERVHEARARSSDVHPYLEIDDALFALAFGTFLRVFEMPRLG